MWGARNKFGAVKTITDGYTFDSKLEASAYSLLRLEGIHVTQVHDHIYLSDARILYIPDFRCETESGEIFWAEAKGKESQRWPMIKKLWRAYGPGSLRIYKGHYSRPILTETLIPMTRKPCGCLNTSSPTS